MKLGWLLGHKPCPELYENKFEKIAKDLVDLLKELGLYEEAKRIEELLKRYLGRLK